MQINFFSDPEYNFSLKMSRERAASSNKNQNRIKHECYTKFAINACTKSSIKPNRMNLAKSGQKKATRSKFEKDQVCAQRDIRITKYQSDQIIINTKWDQQYIRRKKYVYLE